MRAQFFYFWVILFSSPAWAVEDCDHKVNLNNGYTYKDLTANVTCVDRDSGKLTQQIPFMNGKKHGEVKTYHFQTGRLLRIEPYQHDELHGVVSAFDPDTGKLSCTMTYQKNRLDGPETCYYPNGKVKYIKYNRADNQQDTVVRFTPSEKLSDLTCGEHSVHPDDRLWCGFTAKESAVELFDDADKLKSRLRYKDAKLNGLQEYFYANGNPKEKTEYLNAKRHGVSEKYREDGTLIGKLNYRDHYLYGEQITFFEDGVKQQSSTWVENQIPLAFKEWYQNGKLKAEMKIDGNRKFEKEYHDNGQLAHELEYIEVKYKYQNEWVIHGEEKSYFENGQVAAEKQYNDAGKKDGEEKIYYENGQLSKHLYWKNDVLERKITYKENGEIDKDESYYPDGSRK